MDLEYDKLWMQLSLSAGFGTRMQPYTNRIAKPAIEFLTVPMLGYSLFYLEALELEKVL